MNVLYDQVIFIQRPSLNIRSIFEYVRPVHVALEIRCFTPEFLEDGHHRFRTVFYPLLPFETVE